MQYNIERFKKKFDIQDRLLERLNCMQLLCMQSIGILGFIKILITYMNYYDILDNGKQSAMEAFLILAPILMISPLFVGVG
jgi:hypothetical protein